MTRRIRALMAGLVTIASVTVAQVPAMAASASPPSIVVDCDLANGVVGTTITGLAGDSVTVDNTAGTDGCTFASYSGIVTATNLNGSGVLAAGAVTTLTIISTGTFTITPLSTGGSGTTATMTVALGTPVNVPSYTITFDANGGSCGSNAQSVTAASGEWYALPSDGTGPYQCHRDYYVLTGWSYETTTLAAGAVEEVPDLAVPAPATAPAPTIPGSGASPVQADPSGSSAPSAGSASAQIADHETLYAVWSPLGVEITFDANIAAADACLDFAGNDLAVADRSTDAEVYFAGTDDTLATSAPCSPADGSGGTLPLTGWALTGDGAVAYAPGVDLTMTRFAPGTKQTLYAVWGFPAEAGSVLVEDENLTVAYEVDSSTDELVMTMTMTSAPNMWVGVGFHNFMFPADSMVLTFNAAEEGGNLQFFDGYNPGIPTLSFFPAPAPDDDPIFVSPHMDPTDNQENWSGALLSDNGGTRVVEMRRKLITDDIFDIQFRVDGQYSTCVAYTMTSGYDMTDTDSAQAAHTKYICGVMYLR